MPSKDSSNLATDASESRYRDWDIFQYWFRAVETYAPWVRNVYLVTCGHLPAWINTDNSKLKIIRHDEYIPKQYLPTFSSHPIELNLWRIPDLSEHFVYFNDDMILSSPTHKEDFFQNGLPKYTAVANPLRAYIGMTAFEHVLLNNLGLFNSVYDFRKVISKHPEKWFSPQYGKHKEFNRRVYKDHFLSGMQFSHLCYPFRKSTMKACWEAFFAAFDRTCSNKFRSSEDINHQVFQIWEMVHATFTPVKAGYYGSVRNIKRSTIDLVETDLFKDKNICVCLNDSMGFDPADFPFLKTRLLEMLMRKFPSKSSFEK